MKSSAPVHFRNRWFGAACGRGSVNAPVLGPCGLCINMTLRRDKPLESGADNFHGFILLVFIGATVRWA